MYAGADLEKYKQSDAMTRVGEMPKIQMFRELRPTQVQ